MQFTTLKDFIAKYKSTVNKESSFAFQEWIYDNELIENDILLNKNLDYIKVCEENVLDRHSYFLKDYISVIELTDAEYRKYRCNAHRLSYDLYGTTMLWFLLLNLNELYSESEFNLKRIKVYNSNVIQRLVEIKLAEDRELNLNKATVRKMTNAIVRYFDNLNITENEYDAE